ncbi:MAG: hypothetical protein WKF84_23060 [Pyrinomonadaceae bacterium]
MVAMRPKDIFTLSGINRINSDLGVHRHEVLTAIILVAALVVAARILAPFEIRQDQSLQLEAAQRLCQGLGLTTTRSVATSLDVAEGPAPVYLTDWPPAFSLIVAGFLLSGMPLEIALKVIYAFTSLMGWIGWGIVANYFVARHFKKEVKIPWIYLVIPSLLPVLYTPWWGGTDIFLWAGVPYIVLLLFLANYHQRSAKFIVSAGLLFGFLCSIRYASFFIAIAASLILLQTTFPSIKLFLQRSALFFLPSLIFILPVFIYVNQYRPAESNLPQLGNSEFAWTLLETLASLSTASVMLTGFPWLLHIVRQSEALNYAVGLGTLLIIISLPLMLWKSTASSFSRLRENASLSFSLLPLSVVLFLVVIALMSGMIYIAEQRYFQAVGLIGVFIAFDLFMNRQAPRLLRTASGVIVAAFVAYSLVYLMFVGIPRKRADLIHTVLSYTQSRSRELSTSDDIGYPEHRLYTRKEGSRRKLKELHASYPGAIFFILRNYQLYVYDNLQEKAPVTGLDLRLFPTIDHWKRSYTSKAINVFWVLEQPTAEMNLKESQLSFVPNVNLKSVYYDPFEKTMILKSNFPAGHKFFNDNLQNSKPALH